MTIYSHEKNNLAIEIDRLILFGVLACFFLSGFSALLYQTAWLRQFSVVFGTSELAVVTVLAAYMAGLAVGAAIAGRYVNQITRPVFVYGTLEAGIAISALAIPFLLTGAGVFYSFLLGGQPQLPHSADIGQMIYYLSVSFLILAIPTGFMGATFPLLTRYAVRSNEQVGTRVALLYAVNTTGAVFGTVIAGFMLLPHLGLYGTVWVGVIVNVLVFFIAITVARYIQPLAVKTNRDVENSPVIVQTDLPISFIRHCIVPVFDHSRPFKKRLQFILHTQPAWILPIMLFSGANAFLYEVLWTRLITHVVGGSVYAFATMLASFLAGIAIGSSAAGKFAANRDKAVAYFALVQICISVFSIFVYAYIQQLIPNASGHVENALFAAMVMLPSTIFIGATFPFAVRILSQDEHDVSICSARIYAWNTLGAIIGAIMAGFYLIPALGFPGAIKFAVVINIILALWVLVTIYRPMMVETVGLVIALGLLFVFYQPSIPSIVLNSAFPQDLETNNNFKEHYFAVGRSSTVLLTESDGRFNLRTNGLPESSINYRGAPPTKKNMQWLTSLPLIMRPETESMLVVGFGGGVALQSMPLSVKEIDVVELEPEVINANRTIGAYRSYDPLKDPRVNVVINDARNALQLTTKRYDAIVSQPSHPWTAGASHLYTKEFLQLAEIHLNKNGVFLQWMNSQFVDDALLRALSATILEVFEFVRLYSPQPEVLLFIASNKPFSVDEKIVNSGHNIKDYLADYSYLGLDSIEDLMTILLVDENGLKRFSQDAPISTDNNNLMAMRSQYRGDGLTAKEVNELLAPYDPLTDVNNWLYKRYSSQLNFAYIALSLAQKEAMQRANNLIEVAPDASTKSLIEALGLPMQGNDKKIYMLLRDAIREDPKNEQARFALVEYYLARLATDKAPREIKKIANDLQGSAAAVVDGWKFSVNNDYKSLAQLEQKLKQAATTDLWYPRALQLRAEWRIMLSASTADNQYLLEALNLVDRALVKQSRVSLYLLRVKCARLLEDPEIFIETVRYLVQSVDEKISQTMKEGGSLSKDYLRETQIDLANLKTQMATDFLQPVNQRAKIVRSDIDMLLKEIKKEM